MNYIVNWYFQTEIVKVNNLLDSAMKNLEYLDDNNKNLKKTNEELEKELKKVKLDLWYMTQDKERFQDENVYLYRFKNDTIALKAEIEKLKKEITITKQ